MPAARPVKVGVLRQPHLSHALFYDRYLPTNVKLEIVPFANSTEIKNAVVSGDLAFGVTGITAALQGAANDEPVVIVASAADGGSAIVAKEGAGISSVADLRGNRPTPWSRAARCWKVVTIGAYGHYEFPGVLTESYLTEAMVRRECLDKLGSLADGSVSGHPRSVIT